MYYQNYEDYMRSVLGYDPNPTPSCTYNMTDNVYTMQQPPSVGNYPVAEPMKTLEIVDDLESMYPDIYKLVNPMVCKACDMNTRPITKQVVEEMTEAIYAAIEVDETVKVEVNKETTTTVKKETREVSKNIRPQSKEVREAKVPKAETRAETRQRPNNYLLRDIIKILILNNLLNCPGGRPPMPPRPPMPGPGPRPPMPPGPRPPFPGRPEPRNYDIYY